MGPFSNTGSGQFVYENRLLSPPIPLDLRRLCALWFSYTLITQIRAFDEKKQVFISFQTRFLDIL